MERESVLTELSSSSQVVALGGSHLSRLHTALLGSFTRSELGQLLQFELGVRLDEVVAAQGRNDSDVAYDVVLWALHADGTGLQGLLAAALRQNPSSADLVKLQQEWAGVVFGPPECPYPGMRPFAAREKERFYGRGAEIQQAVDALRRHPFLAVIGPSGSGKSSLLAAGVVPALRTSHFFSDMRWVVLSMRPGAEACVELARLLHMPEGQLVGSQGRLPSLGADERLLLVVDQFEELFTTAGAEQRDKFAQALLHLNARPDVYLVLAARADFYAGLMASALWPKVRDHRHEVTPLRGDALREAIQRPAQDVGVRLEPELVERLLADAGDEPGVLPFVQETLVMLWGRAGRLAIGLDAYTDLVGDKSGRSGLQVALARHADHVYASVLQSDEQRSVARRILLRLVQFGQGRPDTRRRQTVDELRKGMEHAQEFDAALAELTANRLLTLGDEMRQVDLAHEALITGWPRLREWIDQRRVAELTRRRLEDKAAERERMRQANQDGGLLDAVELAEAEAWVNGQDAADLGVSRGLAALAADSRSSIEAVTLEKERSARRLRRLNAGLAVALVAALAAAAVAVNYFTRSEKAAGEARVAQASAEASARRSRANELAANGQSALVSSMEYPDLPLLLAIEAILTTFGADGELVTPLAEAQLQAAIDSARSLQARHTFAGSEWNYLNSAEFSPDGRLVLTASEDGAVVWEAATGKEVRRLGGSAYSASFSPDGKLIASAGLDGAVRVWDAANGAALWQQLGDGEYVGVARFSPDGALLVTAGGSNVGRIWDTGTGEEVQQLAGHDGAVRDAVFSPDGTLVFTSDGDSNIVRVFEAATGKELRQFSATPSSVAFSPDGRVFVSEGTGSAIDVWDTATGELRQQLAGSEPATPAAAATSPDGRYIVVVSGETPRVWHLATGEEFRRLSGHRQPVNSVAFSRDSKQIVTVGDDRMVRVWDAVPAPSPRVLIGHDGIVNMARFSPDGELVVTAGSDHTARTWDAKTGEDLHTLDGHEDAVNMAAFSPNGRYIVTASDDQDVGIWDAASGELLQGLRGHEGAVNTAAFSPDGKLIVTASDDQTVRVWSAVTGGELRQLPRFEEAVEAAYFSPDGKAVVVSVMYEDAAIYDAASGEKLRQLESTHGNAGLAAFSSDGRSIITSSVDTVEIWDAATGKQLRQFVNNMFSNVRSGASGWFLDFLASAALSPDGKSIVVTGASAGPASVWDAESGEQLRLLQGHSDRVYWAEYSPDGKYIVTAGSDGTARIWTAHVNDMLTEAQALILRYPPTFNDQERIRYEIVEDLEVE